AQIISGTALFTARDGRVHDLNLLPEPELRQLRGDEIAMVFQDPGNSLNPVHRIYHQLAETIRAHRPANRSAVAVQAMGLLREVGLPDAERRAHAFPHELSGGQLQRAMMAMAIANGPRLLIADEPTTALDVTIQAQILDLLAALKSRSQSMGLMFVTHNLAVVAEIAQRVCVMYAGQIVEEGPVSEVFARPRHPYTAALIASVPEAGSGRLVAIPGTVSQPSALTRGCCFAARCPRSGPECTADSPVLEWISSGRATRCIKWRELA
ncbi:MAG: ABC transporter ATP-binding protein, partial [Hyphomicrobiales bacterium]|nr:ABC transporter ATP-binding protein [Hyphomicrobiales bacterium]